jgi:Protein of unknown function (DUF3592)
VGVTFFGFLMLLVIGVVFAVLGSASMAKRWRKRSWVQTFAIVKSSETKLVRTDEGSYTADFLHYQYSNDLWQHEGIAEKRIKRYQVGQALRLRYNPVNPQEHELTFRGEWLLYSLFDWGGFVALFYAYKIWGYL